MWTADSTYSGCEGSVYFHRAGRNVRSIFIEIHAYVFFQEYGNRFLKKRF